MAEISVDCGRSQIAGIADGIDEFGRFCILTDRGAEYVSAGDVSVRPVMDLLIDFGNSRLKWCLWDDDLVVEQGHIDLDALESGLRS